MTTKREDAESIIEDEEVIKGLDLKSQADDVLVLKMDEEHEDEQDGKKKKPVKEEAEEKSVAAPAAPELEPVAENTVFPPAEPTPIEKSFLALKSKVEAIKSQGLTGEAALQQVQADFDQIGEVIKAEFTPPPSPEDEARKSLETTLRSLLNEMLPAALATTVAPIQSKLDSLEGELRAKSLTTPIKPEKVETVQRSLVPTQVQKAAIEQIAHKSVSQFDLIARQSVGLTQ